jgi:hypothetical protein
MKKSKDQGPSPFGKTSTPKCEPETPVDRTYPTLPMKAVIKNYGEVEFAEQVRADPNGDYAVVPKDKCCGDGTGA